jgi:putative MFS transporter
MRFWSAAGGQHRRRAVLLSALYFLSPWATIGFPLLSGAVLVEKGFKVADSLLYLGVAMFGPSLGAVAAAFIIDRVERRTALVLCGAAMALFGLGFAASAMPAPLMAFGLAFNLVAAIHIGVLGIYGAELFPTALRAAASAGAFAVNRIASALVPLALLPLLKAGGPMVMTSVIAAVLVGGIALVLTFGPRGLARRPVQ